jgi:hypothetical protein
MKQTINSDQQGARALLIRHAKRDPIARGESVWLAKLTPEGRQDARAYGAGLRDSVFGGAYSSPIPRCLDTARLILEGWGYSNETVVPDRFLLSAYVKERETVKGQFAALDPFQLILDQIAGKTIPGFLSLEEGSWILLNEMKKRTVPGALTLFISHDALLMPFRTHFLGDTFSREKWLPFLGSAAIVVEENSISIDGKPVHRGSLGFRKISSD